MAFRRRTIILIIFFVDLIALNVSLTLTSLWHYNKVIWLSELFYLLNGTWAVVFIYLLSDRFFNTESIRERSLSLIKKILLYMFMGSFLIVVLNKDDISRTMFLGSTLVFMAFKLVLSIPYNYLITHRRDGGYFNRILVIGANKIGEAIDAFYKMNSERGRVIGFLEDDVNEAGDLKILGSVAEFQKVFETTRFNEVIITLDFSNAELIKSIVKSAEFNGVRPSVVANNYSLFARNFDVNDIGGIPSLQVREVPLESYFGRIQKRLFDIFFSSFALLMMSPIFVGLAILIKLDTKGPVFYKPVRVGRRGKEFSVYKFRSMIHGHNSQTKSTAKNDERITKVGKFIRKYSLDELPQFINVLTGEMSVVGPRPHRVDLNKRFQLTAQSYMVRQYIKPGITGWAQVNGWRGPTETKFQYVARTLHDLWYLEHWTFALDLYIIYLTIFGKKTSKNAF